MRAAGPPGPRFLSPAWTARQQLVTRSRRWIAQSPPLRADTKSPGRGDYTPKATRPWRPRFGQMAQKDNAPLSDILDDDDRGHMGSIAEAEERDAEYLAEIRRQFEEEEREEEEQKLKGRNEDGRQASVVDLPEHNRSRRKQSTSKKRETHRSLDRNESILHDLFPEEFEVRRSDHTEVSPRDVPKLDPTEAGLPKLATWQPSTTSLTGSALPGDPAEEIIQDSVWRRSTKAILILSCASLTLTPRDFTRLAPPGEHIENWNSGLLRVIPGRNPVTLKRLPFYILLFSSRHAAEAYREKVSRLHLLSVNFTPRALISKVPAPKAEIRDEVKFATQQFTLISPQQKRVPIKELQRPWSNAVERLVARGGYHPMITEQAENVVLLTVDRGSMGILGLTKAIAHDGRDRNLPWKKDGRIVQLGTTESSTPDLKTIPFDQESFEGGEGNEEKALKEAYSTERRFLVKFKDALEARRFARSWHLKSLEGEEYEKLTRAGLDTPATVTAEVLW